MPACSRSHGSALVQVAAPAGQQMQWARQQGGANKHQPTGAAHQVEPEQISLVLGPPRGRQLAQVGKDVQGHLRCDIGEPHELLRAALCPALVLAPGWEPAQQPGPALARRVVQHAPAVDLQPGKRWLSLRQGSHVQHCPLARHHSPKPSSRRPQPR